MQHSVVGWWRRALASRTPPSHQGKFARYSGTERCRVHSACAMGEAFDKCFGLCLVVSMFALIGWSLCFLFVRIGNGIGEDEGWTSAWRGATSTCAGSAPPPLDVCDAHPWCTWMKDSACVLNVTFTDSQEFEDLCKQVQSPEACADKDVCEWKDDCRQCSTITADRPHRRETRLLPSRPSSQET